MHKKEPTLISVSNARTFPRFPDRLRVEYRVDDGEGIAHARTRVAFTRDVSPSGIYVATSSVLEKGTSVWFRIYLPDNRWIETTGSIAWSKFAPLKLAHTLHAGFGAHISPSDEAWFMHCMNVSEIRMRAA